MKPPKDIRKPLTEESMLGVPDTLWDSLNEEFCFTVDVCSSDSNFKTEKHYTKETDGLKQNWDGETVWCHPLFDRNIHKWIRKALASKALTVMLLPASVETKWFSILWDRELHKPKSNVQIRFIEGRLTYKPATKPACFPSCVIVIDNK